jgi:Domain of Unknown Function (DUF1206)
LPRRKPVKPWVERLARVGYVTKGAVYIIVGALATLAAFRAGGKTTDHQGAFKEIFTQPLGGVLTIIVGVGLTAYALWRIIQAMVDAEGKGSDMKGLAIRSVYTFSGLVHAALAASAFKVVLNGGNSGSGDQEKREWTASLMQMPFGTWVVGIIGAGFLAAAAWNVYKGNKFKFRKRLDVGDMNETEDTLAKRSGQIGHTARGVVFAIIGVFLIRAAIKYDPNEAGGLGDALRTLAGSPLGPWVLAVVAVGLVAYGGYMMIEAKYHRIITE